MSAKIRARMLEQAEGTYVHVGDFMQALANENLVLESAAMIKMAQQMKLNPTAGVRMCIANVMNEVTGLNEEMFKADRQRERLQVAKIVIEEGGARVPDKG